MKRLCLALVLSLMIMVPLVPRITVQTVWSNPATIVVPGDYPTVQAAINAAVTGDTVFVRNGTYYEHIEINRPLTLVGEDSKTTIIDGNGTGTVALITASYASISNFTIRNAGLNLWPSPFDSCVYVVMELSGVDVENNIISNCGVGICVGDGYGANVNGNIISNTTGCGILVGGPQSRNLTVSNNLISNSDYCGISVNGDTEDCNFINNTIRDCALGMELMPNRNIQIIPSNNLFDGNVLSNNSIVNLYVICPQSFLQWNYKNTFRRNNLTNLEHNNLIVWGWNTSAVFMQDIDASNTANGKSIYYLTNSRDLEIDPSNYPDAGYVALVNCANVTVKDFDFAGNKDGLLLAGTNNCTLANMSLGNNRLYMTEENVTVLSHWGGLTLFESDNNTIEDCTIRDSSYGVCLYYSDLNLFLHNIFAGNDRNVASDYYWLNGNYTSGYLSSNFWDDGYSSAGNYWKDYNGTDSNGDGIGDTPYIIDVNNTDHYPLMSPYWYWSSPAACDLNRDMKTDLKDVASAAACFGSRAGDPKWNPREDVTGDGTIDIRDLVAIAKHFGEHHP